MDGIYLSDAGQNEHVCQQSHQEHLKVGMKTRRHDVEEAGVVLKGLVTITEGRGT